MFLLPWKHFSQTLLVSWLFDSLDQPGIEAIFERCICAIQIGGPSRAVVQMKGGSVCGRVKTGKIITDILLFPTRGDDRAA